MNYRLTIRECNESAVVFATDLMISKLIDDQTIHFDATFKVVPRLFYQLFTIAFTTVFPSIILVGCWFHYTKALHEKVQKLDLGKLYKINKVFKTWINQLMSLPFLVEEDIQPTYLTINLPTDGLNGSELELINSFKKYFTKTWIDGSVSLSVFYYEINTNNGAESYHKSLQSCIKTNHPNIWKFMSLMNNVLSDYDLEIRRLDNGLETTRGPKLITRLNADLRTKYKTKYLNKTYTPLEYINCISLTIGSENKTI